MRKVLLPAIALVAVALVLFGRADVSPFSKAGEPLSVETDSVLASAFARQTSNVQVEGRGTVVRTLADDNVGGRHQRFIVRLGSGQTILVAHNVDLAARIPALKEGDQITFHGEYDWNDKGGVLHWTHHDPAGRHPNGWIKHNGRVFQ